MHIVYDSTYMQFHEVRTEYLVNDKALPARGLGRGKKEAGTRGT